MEINKWDAIEIWIHLVLLNAKDIYDGIQSVNISYDLGTKFQITLTDESFADWTGISSTPEGAARKVLLNLSRDMGE